MNNCFAYDLVPTTEVIDAALRAARKCNDYATAVRILEGVKEKVENKGQYKAYLEELSPVLKELGESLVSSQIAFFSYDVCYGEDRNSGGIGIQPSMGIGPRAEYAEF